MDKIHKRIVGLLVLSLALAAVHARGGREILTQPADGIGIWQKEFDVSDVEPGTYNIIINAKDAAGNNGVSGPFNIKVDPLAGLPEARVVYPEHRQIIREDINIVGVATARYGLKQILVKIDDEEYRTLEGKEYWNLHIPAMDLLEGKHTISVKAIDTHDLTGPEAKFDFILDVTPPAIELVSHQIGDFISGTVRVEGKVNDPNAIQSLSLSTDGQQFRPLRLKKKRGDDNYYFQFTIRSKDYADGPLVYYLRAVNATGRTDTRPFLFFVNNNPPKIEIISPAPAENTFGRTQVTGRVITGIGLEEFYYEWAGEKVDIPLRPGDPFWAVTFPISMANNRGIPFRVTAVDLSGNVTTLTQNFQDTRRNKSPALVIDYPPTAAGLGRLNLEPDQPIYGHILPGFFPYAIMIEGQIEYIPAQPGFRIPPELIPVGRSTMRLWAIDEDDVTGEPFSLRINKAAPPEGFELVESPVTIDNLSGRMYDPFEHFWFSDSVTVAGYIDDYNIGQTLEYRTHWNEEWQQVSVDAGGAFECTVSLDAFPEGPVPMEFRTVRDGKADVPVYVPVNKYTTQPVITFLTPAEQYGPSHGDVITTGVVDYLVPLTEITYSIDNGETFERINYTAKYGKAWFNGSFDYTDLQSNEQRLIIRAVDRAGNTVEASPAIQFDNSTDSPHLILNSPLDGDLITGDFEMSGLGFDDDGIKMVYWRILSPQNPWNTVEETLSQYNDIEYEAQEVTQNFQIPLTLEDVLDGENILEIFVEDIYGVPCETIRRIFTVSTAPPDTVVTEPAIDVWNRRNIVVSGTAYDKNGIASVSVSMDNGVSYQRADCISSQEEPSVWNVNLNTKAYTDGIYSMLVRTVDNYGVSSFTSGIINIDNRQPVIDLVSPGNGDRIGETLSVTGQVADNVNIASLSIELVNIENPAQRETFELPKELVIMESLDVSALTDGSYSLTLTARDQSENETTLIRNFSILKAGAASEVALMNPLPGIIHSGPVVISGRITGAVVPEKVSLMLNRQLHANVPVDRYGIFHYDLPENAVSIEEPVVFSASFVTPGGDEIVSYENLVKLNREGPVVVVDSHHDGDVITQRPWISGRAFFVFPEGEDLADKLTLSGAKVRQVELSLDNGRSFSVAEQKARPAAGLSVNAASGEVDWKYRLETGELNSGTLPIVIKATFENSSVAIRRILLTVDTRPPVVNTIGPVENSSHRSSVLVYGSTSDNFDMDTVEISLRPGDKAAYSVPGFIQGLYVDVNFLGGLNYMMGVGLTFFDDNVKVQFNAAQAAPGSRYTGWAFGGKILANIFTQNLSGWFGPDWEFYTTSLTVGAHFSYFLMEEGVQPLWMGQFLGQWEIIKADLSYLFPKWKYFKTISLYAEPGIWFAPSDVNSEQAWRTKFTIAFGGRISLF